MSFLLCASLPKHIHQEGLPGQPIAEPLNVRIGAHRARARDDAGRIDQPFGAQIIARVHECAHEGRA